MHSLVRPVRLPRRPRRGRLAAGAALAVAAALLPIGGGGAVYGSDGTPRFTDAGDRLEVAVPASPSASSSGYKVEVSRSPFRVTTLRGSDTVLQSTGAGPSTYDFKLPSGTAHATEVTGSSWTDGALVLQVATDVPGYSLAVRLTFGADRYHVVATVQGPQAPSWVAVHYTMSRSGHWYGHGEAHTDKDGPYRDQPWPLDDQSDSGAVTDEAFGPASYDMVEPFWFTQAGSGVYVDTTHLMTATLGGYQKDVAGFLVNDTGTLDQTVFVEQSPRQVFEDYIGIAGKPDKSDAPDYQYRTPVWNSWAQFYTDVTQKRFVDWARGIHDAGLAAHTFNLDDGWMSHYGDFTFNDKFPDPKAMSDEVHAMGSKFGLWVTLWINLDADNYQVAKQHGYLLKSKTDPSQPCTVSWWNGKAGIVDLANPDARKWYVDQLHGVQEKFDVDGFKFDTRFFDEGCSPYTSDLTMADYQRLGADMADEFDLQGMGIRVHWTGSQRHGFVMRQIDKSTDWPSLNAAVTQNLALSTVGYPFVTTDMIGGSLGGFPPSKEVLVRWAQAAAAMPLMYSSTSPLGVSNFAGSRTYDPETVRLYRQAVELHQRLAPYILDQVDRATADGEPIMKPIFFDFPTDPASYTVDDEWLLGDSLLAAPVLGDGELRDVHLPPGRWFDVARGRVVSGPAELSGYRADLATVPLFVRLGQRDTGRLMQATAGAASR
jgi:alpha-glucosidase (family GH31 glycosyl hydrolase)